MPYRTVTPQLMLPLVGDLAPPHRRASSLSIVVSGLALGMLIARLLSGILANFTSWRNIYWLVSHDLDVPRSSTDVRMF